MTYDTKKPAPQPKRSPHGFDFGIATVTAMTSDERGNAHIGIETPKAKIIVHVTPTGLLRVWVNGMQMAAKK